MKNKEMKSKNVIWRDPVIAKKHREVVYGHKGAVIWLTGLPSAGKSTIAVELELQLFGKGIHVFVLDGDNIRHGLNKNLGFSPEDRFENIRRIGEVAKLFAEAGFLVITAFISPYRKDRDNVRAMLPKGDFIEIFVKTSLEECERRDPKGNYQKARKGEIKEFTGISAPYEEPTSPEIVIETEKKSGSACVQQIIDYLQKHGYLPRIS